MHSLVKSYSELRLTGRLPGTSWAYRGSLPVIGQPSRPLRSDHRGKLALLSPTSFIREGNNCARGGYQGGRNKSEREHADFLNRRMLLIRLKLYDTGDSRFVSDRIAQNPQQCRCGRCSRHLYRQNTITKPFNSQGGEGEWADGGRFSLTSVVAK